MYHPSPVVDTVACRRDDQTGTIRAVTRSLETIFAIRAA